MKPNLPEDYRARPCTEADIPELAALDAAYTSCLFGRSLQTEGEIRTEWKAPYFDPRKDSQLVRDASGRLVGWGEIYDFAPHVKMQSKVRVDPGTAQEGVGEFLVRWCIDRARASIGKAPENARVILTQAAFERDAKANRRLSSAGLIPIRVFLRMQIELTAPPEVPAWPEGIVVRPFVAGKDDVAAIEASRDVFRDHWGYVETPLEDDLEEWRQWIYEDEDFDTDLWFLAFDRDEIVGFCQGYPVSGNDPRIGLIDELGVRRPHRGRGLATSLLLHAFGAFYQRGKPIVELGVDAESLTGATRLYEKVGMKLVRRTNLYELELRHGNDLTTQSSQAEAG